MRILIFGLLLVGSVIVAQQRREPDQIQTMQRQMTLLDRPLGERSVGGEGANYSADRIEKEGAVVRLDGRVRIKTSGFVLTADRAEYRPESGQIDAHGDVHVQVLPNRRPQMGVTAPSQNRW